jgi:hypothetical protein
MTALRKITPIMLSKRGKNNWITGYIPRETILKEMAAKIKLSQCFFFDLVQELSNSTLYESTENQQEPRKK